MCRLCATRAINEFTAKVDELNQLINYLSTDLHSTKLTDNILNSSYTYIDDHFKSNNIDKQGSVNVGNCDGNNRLITQVDNHFKSENVDKQTCY
ncbi:hypothetical protein GJ496_009587 [Pomphorhynchus laevis]|nr:hypothetical protein GJ496_009587 [Pomphorhynchus laevis]